MVHAIAMVKTGPGRSEAVRDGVLELDGVVEAHVVAGEFDVILEVNAEEMSDVLHTVSGRVQDIEGVLETKTYISLG